MDLSFVTIEDAEEEPEPGPEVPPPCWDERPIDGAKAMEAVRLACGGSRRPE